LPHPWLCLREKPCELANVLVPPIFTREFFPSSPPFSSCRLGKTFVSFFMLVSKRGSASPPQPSPTPDSNGLLARLFSYAYSSPSPYPLCFFLPGFKVHPLPEGRPFPPLLKAPPAFIFGLLWNFWQAIWWAGSMDRPSAAPRWPVAAADFFFPLPEVDAHLRTHIFLGHH